MILTLRDFDRIVFPAFILPNSNWHTQDGLFFVDNKLVDDRNIDRPTLGQRRLASPQGNFMPLGKAIIGEIPLIKQTANTFIDSSGTPFIYLKTKMASLKYYRIEEIEGITHSCRIKLVGVRTKFLLPRPPDSSMLWAGVLHLQGYAWRIYEFSEEYKSPTRRKI